MVIILNINNWKHHHSNPIIADCPKALRNYYPCISDQTYFLIVHIFLLLSRNDHDIFESHREVFRTTFRPPKHYFSLLQVALEQPPYIKCHLRGQAPQWSRASSFNLTWTERSQVWIQQPPNLLFKRFLISNRLLRIILI